MEEKAQNNVKNVHTVLLKKYVCGRTSCKAGSPGDVSEDPVT